MLGIRKDKVVPCLWLEHNKMLSGSSSAPFSAVLLTYYPDLNNNLLISYLSIMLLPLLLLYHMFFRLEHIYVCVYTIHTHIYPVMTKGLYKDDCPSLTQIKYIYS